MFTHIIYHKACPDGFASAYIAWKVLGNTPAYIPQSYYDKLPDIKNGKLLVCDFSFNEKETLKLIHTIPYIKNLMLYSTSRNQSYLL